MQPTFNVQYTISKNESLYTIENNAKMASQTTRRGGLAEGWPTPQPLQWWMHIAR